MSRGFLQPLVYYAASRNRILTSMTFFMGWHSVRETIGRRNPELHPTQEDPVAWRLPGVSDRNGQTLEMRNPGFGQRCGSLPRRKPGCMHHGFKREAPEGLLPDRYFHEATRRRIGDGVSPWQRAILFEACSNSGKGLTESRRNHCRPSW